MGRWHHCRVRPRSPLPLNPERRARLRLLAAMAGAVLLSHAALMLGWPAPAQPAAALPSNVVPATRSVQAVRFVAVEPARSAVAPQRSAPAAEPQRSKPVVVQRASAAEVTQPVQAVAAGAPSGESPSPPIPTYATRRPPPVLMHFEMNRGGLTGQAELAWLPREDGYALTLVGRGLGRPLLRSESSGGWDAAGLAPLRFVDRRRREAQAANFRRDEGRIAYSGPAIEHPLVPGAQDRLSWMLQLAAIVAAEPAAFAIGSRITMFVTGARGDADAWTFAVEAMEPVEVPEGRIEGAWRLVREARRVYDTRVEVWLDPARSFLPVRLLLSPSQGGEGVEFALQRMSLQP